jgi:hypothetical protein
VKDYERYAETLALGRQPGWPMSDTSRWPVGLAVRWA